MSHQFTDEEAAEFERLLYPFTRPKLLCSECNGMIEETEYYRYGHEDLCVDCFDRRYKTDDVIICDSCGDYAEEGWRFGTRILCESCTKDKYLRTLNFYAT